MGFGLKGAFTGLFDAMAEDLKTERQEARAVIADNTKRAYENYLTYQEETTALKEQVKKLDSEALSYQGDLTDDERIAIATTPAILQAYKETIKNNPYLTQTNNPNRVTLRNFISKKKSTPALAFNAWVEGLGNPPQEGDPNLPIVEDSSWTTPSEGYQRGVQEKLATSYGVTTEEIAPFLKKPAKPSLTPAASVNFDAIPDLRTPDTRVEELSAVLMNNSPDSDAYKKASKQIEDIALKAIGVTMATGDVEAQIKAIGQRLMKVDPASEEAFQLNAQLEKAMLIQSKMEQKDGAKDVLSFTVLLSNIDRRTLSDLYQAGYTSEQLNSMNVIEQIPQIGDNPPITRIRPISGAEHPKVLEIRRRSVIAYLADERGGGARISRNEDGSLYISKAAAEVLKSEGISNAEVERIMGGAKPNNSQSGSPTPDPTTNQQQGQQQEQQSPAPPTGKGTFKYRQKDIDDELKIEREKNPSITEKELLYKYEQIAIEKGYSGLQKID